MRREVYIGTTIPQPKGAYIVDIPAIHLQNHLYDCLRDYVESRPDPIIYIPDVRIITSDCLRNMISIFRVFPYVDIVACARQEQHVPHLLKYILKPIRTSVTNTHTTLKDIYHKHMRDSEIPELLSELYDLGFLEETRSLYIDLLN